MKLKHLCDSCTHEIVSCNSKPLFGIDLDNFSPLPVQRDLVVQCDSYVRDTEASEYIVKFHNSRYDKHSFLVAMVPVPDLPKDLELNPDIPVTGCAIVAASISTGTTTLWAYTHLEAGEKEAIGIALSESCHFMNTWIWCNLYHKERQ